jgi:DNA (cytosine-5)-methyltransferase 1
MREAARLQTFDDDFIFPRLINPVSQMIGNAVPPLLAAMLAGEIAKVLDAFAKTPQMKVRKRASA